MTTLYIDVYFLINFTVDLLSLYFGALFAKVKSSVKRLIISSFISALFACFVVLTELKSFIYILMLILNAAILTVVFCGKISAVRQIKLFMAFLIFETLIGGFVTFIYGALDRYFHPLFDDDAIGAENKNLILLALLILIAYGILRLLLIVFNTSRTEENTRIKISILGKEVITEALIDSGNLLCDPIDSSPVIIVKRSALLNLIGNKNITDDERLKTKIRIIPADTVAGEKIFIGIKSDFIRIENSGIEFKNTVVAIDEERGSFGGYPVLLPSYFIT